MSALWHWFLGILFRRTTLVLSLLLCVGGGLVFWHFSRLSSELIRSSALQSAPDYSRILTETRSFYTSDVAGRALGHGVDVTPDYKEKAGSIPIPTTFTLELGERLSANDKGVKVRLYSSLPFPQRRKSGGPRDAYERDALKYLTANPGRSFVRFEKYKGRDSIRYSTADIMLPACVSCHNTRADSPKKDWKVGDVRGVLEVVRPLDKVVAQTNEGLRGTFALMSALSIAALGALSLVVGKLRRNSNELEGRVLARTQDLSRANEMLQSNIAERARVQEQLRAAKEEAEDANRSKSAFLATMSHEIRTPMNAVIGMSGLLLSTPLNAEQKEFAGLIEHSGDALLGIINDILDFSKIEAGRMDLECHALDLNDCIESAFDLVAVRAGEKGIELVHDFDAEAAPPHAILGDSTRLRQVLTNLLSNAVKFTESGEIVLTARARRLDAEEAAHAPATACDIKTGGEHTDAPQNPRYELHFSVRDTGIGIAPDRMDRLFKSFSQVDASTTRKYGGSGLGLTISKRLCEMMGGTMWAESEGEGRGSTFHCTVCAEAASLPPRRHRQAGALPQLQGKRVLIVDDNAANRRILSLQVESWGMRSRATHSPHEALLWIRRGDPFDVAILDFQMPEMDGLMLAQQIRSQPSTSALPLIMCTSIGRLSEAESIGWAAFLTKPVKSSQMFDTLASLFAMDDEQDKAAPNAPTASLFDAEMGARLPLRILLAEDNVVNQKVALRLLQQVGYRADVAANGLEVLAALERQPYDVILMDVQMPEMDGLEASRRVCQLYARAVRPRIIAMTANAMQGDREMCLQAGMDDYLSKPVRSPELIAALARCRALSLEAPIQEPSIESPPRLALPEEQPILDGNSLRRLREAMGEDFLFELIETYLADSEVLVEEMRRAVPSGDVEALRRAAHTLKSNSATFGALGLAAMCKYLEEHGLSEAADETGERVAQIEAEHEKVRTALKALEPQL